MRLRRRSSETMSDQYTKDEDQLLQASQAREILSLRAGVKHWQKELLAARAEAERRRAGLAECQKLTAAQAEALADKADMIFSQAQTIDDLRSVIEAQRVNLEDARMDSIRLAIALNMASEAIENWNGGDKLASMICDTALKMHRAALEGVEADGAEGDEPDTN